MERSSCCLWAWVIGQEAVECWLHYACFGQRHEMVVYGCATRTTSRDEQAPVRATVQVPSIRQGFRVLGFGFNPKP